MANATPRDYLFMRSSILNLTPREVLGDAAATANPVYGVLIDWNQRDTVTTISALANGEVNVYYSIGVLHVGGGSVPELANEGKACVAAAQQMMGAAGPATNDNLPGDGSVRFYLLTKDGVKVMDALEKRIPNNPELLAVYSKAIAVMDGYTVAIAKQLGGG